MLLVIKELQSFDIEPSSHIRNGIGRSQTTVN